MLTVKQVQGHSEVSLGSDSEDDFTKSMARLLYVHNEHASKMRIICGLKEPIASSEKEKRTEEDIKATIDWQRFTDWINRHDELQEYNLVTRRVYSFYHWRYWKQGKIGRDGILDTIQNKMIDCNKN